MRRFFVPAERWGERIELPAEEAHHALRVLRLGPGDRVLVFDGRGQELETRIVALGAQGGQLEPTGPARTRPAGQRIVLGQGMPKADKLEQILQHTTELGVSEVCPLLLTRSIARPAPDKLAGKLERWRRIALEAAKQCRRSDLPEVGEVESLEDFCRRFEAQGPERRGLVLYEAAGPEEEMRAVLSRWSKPGDAGTWLLVGPEGGLTTEEVARARRAGFEVAGMGSRILRTETAGLAVLAVLQYLWDD